MALKLNPSLPLSLLIGASALVACSPAADANIGVDEAPSIQTVEADSTPATITVNVSGFTVEAGSVMVALTDEAGYQGGDALRGAMAAVEGESVTLTFENVPAGHYAIRMYHDADGNGELNTNAFGIPTESFAFSNNAVGVMGPASWADAKFTHGPDGTVQDISF